MGGNCAQKVHHTSLITTNQMYEYIVKGADICALVE
jgi:hypothetical protein